MKAKPPLRKLIDVKGSLEGAAFTHHLVVALLQTKGIPSVRHHGSDPYGREYWTYKVNKADLQRAKLAIANLESLGKEGAA